MGHMTPKIREETLSGKHLSEDEFISTILKEPVSEWAREHFAHSWVCQRVVSDVWTTDWEYVKAKEEGRLHDPGFHEEFRTYLRSLAVKA